VAFGVGFRLRAEDEAMLEVMLGRAPIGTECGVGGAESAREFAIVRGGAGFRLMIGDEVTAEGEEAGALLEELGRELMVYVANYAPERVFVHAGVVGWQGRALVFPGVSFAGKTTLVAELVRAGAEYYSDEYAVVDAEGRVHPYARELQMRRAGGVEQRAVGVSELKGSAGSGAIRVTHVVFAEYVDGGAWAPEAVSAGMAVLEMLRHSIPVQRTPGRVMATLAKMMEGATAWRTVRGEASEAARALLAAVDAGWAETIA
jgi:serine kinase of HPr protein (carbohydrate metabolism regulator)